ncbi:MAG: DUF4394 domain-containing protein [Planctomycetota bacterium]
MKIQRFAQLSLILSLLIALANDTAIGETIYGLTTQNSVAVFDSAAPSILVDGGSVRNLPANAELEAIDYRPATGDIYLLDNMENVYTFDPTSFEATVVGSFTPRIPGLGFAFDFNPAFMSGQFARIITDTNDNRVISGDTGQYLPPVEKTDVFYASGDPNDGADPNVAGIAYTNSVFGSTSTQQYGIDSDLGVLVTVANNAGTLETIGSLGVGTLTNELGFDISGHSGIAYASLQDGLNSMLFTVDLSTGAATSAGWIGSGDVIRSLTVVPIPEPATFALMSIAVVCSVARRR